MPPSHLPSTSRALYRVFIAPIRPQTSIPLLWAPAFSPLTPIRTKTHTKDTARHALSDHYVLDSAINSPVINFVDSAGVFHASMPLIDAVSLVHRNTQHLVEMVPGRVDEYGRPDPDHPPTCKVVGKLELRAQHAKKLDLMRRQAKGLGAGRAPKSMELNWAIAGGDLKHRLKQLQGFLNEGRKVEIMLGSKKKGRKASEEEVQGVLEKLGQAISGVKGAKEIKREGEKGGVLMVTVQGRKEMRKRDRKGEEGVYGKEEEEEGEEGNEEEEGQEESGETEEEAKKKGEGEAAEGEVETEENRRFAAMKRRGHLVRKNN